MTRSSIPKALILEREKKVWALRVRGGTYESIAEELGITFGAVHKILDRMHKRYIARNMDSVDKCRQEQIAELGNIAKESYDAWVRSKGQKIVIKKRARSKDGKMLPGEAVEERYQQEGDPRYLQVYMKAKEDLRKIVGADAPTRNELTGKNGAPIQMETKRMEDAQELLKVVITKVLDKQPDDKDETNG